MIATGVATFIACMIFTAPYGRYSTSRGWGILIPAKVAWFIMESPNLFMPFAVAKIFIADKAIIDTILKLPLANKCLLTMFLFHYIQRSIIYPFFRIHGDYHQSMPISVMALAFLYCCWNGFTQSLSLIIVNQYSGIWISDIRFIIGTLTFLFGFLTNIFSDEVLLNLKKSSLSLSSNEKSVIKSYQIPYGGFFEYCSCANYFGEVIEWFGFAIACWSIPSLAFAIYTFCNLGPRAYHHHNWYKTKFENYPIKRTAIIPFIW